MAGSELSDYHIRKALRSNTGLHSLVPRPSVFDRLQYAKTQAIKNWRCGRPGNEARFARILVSDRIAIQNQLVVMKTKDPLLFWHEVNWCLVPDQATCMYRCNCVHMYSLQSGVPRTHW